MRAFRIACTVGVLALLAAACSSSGAGPVSDGSYVGYASSAGTAPAATLSIAGTSLTVDQGGSSTPYTISDGAAEYTVCGDGGTGTPSPLSGAMTVESIELAEPAIFGDCGITAPDRVTIVDLDSFDDTLGFPFVRWVEFCDTSDDDC